MVLGLAAVTAASAGELLRATAKLKDAQGVTVAHATLIGKRNGVLIQIEISNLQAGTYGFSIHERGTCRGSTFKSAGEHFNPSGAKHGFKDPKGPHDGDLWNVEVPAGGSLRMEQYNARVTLEEGREDSLLREGGTSLIVHAKRDDYRTDPSGDAGSGIACGVITKTGPVQAASSSPR